MHLYPPIAGVAYPWAIERPVTVEAIDGYDGKILPDVFLPGDAAYYETPIRDRRERKFLFIFVLKIINYI